ncbi:unnamed protein product [Phytomonas sp. EM1]|nr:unnamed protein product [Phytomonas sp. EM1]|eukprot:CCW60381.1 unnamed protein product [Phytomonas sp. isolate EM1]
MELVQREGCGNSNGENKNSDLLGQFESREITNRVEFLVLTSAGDSLSSSRASSAIMASTPGAAASLIPSSDSTPCLRLPTRNADELHHLGLGFLSNIKEEAGEVHNADSMGDCGDFRGEVLKLNPSGLAHVLPDSLLSYSGGNSFMQNKLEVYGERIIDT